MNRTNRIIAGSFLAVVAVLAVIALFADAAEKPRRPATVECHAGCELGVEMHRADRRLKHARELREAANAYACAIEQEIKSMRKLRELMHGFPRCDTLRAKNQ